MLAAAQWSVSEAMAFTQFAGVPMTRPTIIKTIKAYDAGWRLTLNGTRWVIDAEKFKDLIKRKIE
jgi:hypothetical protein